MTVKPAPTPLLLRADASARIGTGHVMRCLALAQAWQDTGGRAALAAAELPLALRDRLSSEHCCVNPITAQAGSPADATETIAISERIGAEWVVVDGYQFDCEYLQTLKDAGKRVLAIDDYGHAGRYPVDLVLNQNLGADEQLYADRGPKTRLLLGPRFALLRREFADASQWERSTPDVARKVLVTLGGADPDSVTLKVIDALGLVPVMGVEAIVVVGGSNPHLDSLKDAARRSPVSIDLQLNVTDMASLMRWADVAVAAGGTTSWERAAIGLPGLTLVLAENQQQVAVECATRGLSENLGWHSDITPVVLAERLERLIRDSAARRNMATRGRSTADGCGAKRLLREITGPIVMRLRPATADDARHVWEWANDPATRAASFTTDPIAWESHSRWFKRKIADPQCLFMIAEVDGPIGQVRFDLARDEAVISVGLAPDARGFGYGQIAIRKAIDYLKVTHPGRRVEALIRPTNPASIRTFGAAGFIPAGETSVRDQPALRFVFPQ
jgi:UDP-2,4-diacetamido-2,4,6-trideoxy-beta-L-altropyranose hydrolase